MHQAEPIQFDSGDATYLQWVQQHPNGFVINTTKAHYPQYMVLHRQDATIARNTIGTLDQAASQNEILEKFAPTI